MFTAFHREKNTKEWEEERKVGRSSKRVTASMLSCIFSCNKSHSRKQYWDHLHLGKPFSTNDFSEMIMKSGQEKEPKALSSLCFDLPDQCEGFRFMHEDVGTLIYWKDNRLSCTSDAILEVDEHLVGVEVKCPWSRRSFEQAVDDIRIDYYLQCMMNMELHCIDKWILFVYWSDEEWVKYEFFRDKDTWDEIVYPEICLFLNMKDKYEKPPSRDYFSKCRDAILAGLKDTGCERTPSPNICSRSHVDPQQSDQYPGDQ